MKIYVNDHEFAHLRSNPGAGGYIGHYVKTLCEGWALRATPAVTDNAHLVTCPLCRVKLDERLTSGLWRLQAVTARLQRTPKRDRPVQ